jgi:hypothetical protein
MVDKVTGQGGIDLSGSSSGVGLGSGAGSNSGLIAFFVIVGVAFLVLVVLGGCYSSKGKLGYITRKMLSKITGGGAGSVQSAKPLNARKKKFSAAGTGAAARKPAVASRRRKLTAANMQRQTTKLTGATYGSGATTLRGGSTLSPEEILDAGAQTKGPSGRNQKIAFQGTYVPHNPNASTNQSVRNQARAFDGLKAAGGRGTPPGYHNDADTDFIATHGSAAQRY